jgi:hypothetical protein
MKTHGRWAFVELKDVYTMQTDFAVKVSEAFYEIVTSAAALPRKEVA